MLYQNCGQNGFLEELSKMHCFSSDKNLLSPASFGWKEGQHKETSPLLLPDGVELPNSVHVSLEKVLVLG